MYIFFFISRSKELTATYTLLENARIINWDLIYPVLYAWIMPFILNSEGIKTMIPRRLDPLFLDPNYRYYSMVIVDIGQVRAEYLRRWPELKDRYILRDEEFESLFDWCVLEAFYQNRLKSVGSNILHHYKHDVYSIIYEELASDWQLFFHTTPAMKDVVIKSSQYIKVLVAGFNLIVAQQGTFT